MQANFLIAWNYRSNPWAFFVINNVESLKGDKVQQMMCTICLTNMVPPTLIEKIQRGKNNYAYNKSYEIGFMKWHVKFKHVNILTTYVVNLVSDSESMSLYYILKQQWCLFVCLFVCLWWQTGQGRAARSDTRPRDLLAARSNRLGGGRAGRPGQLLRGAARGAISIKEILGENRGTCI